ncbi:hypothetical protein [uncultured Chryseobacterium sp.]|uniref:hypothetical protein n=1 Tax=uncultured Chryseobacterium sp. TaxID=259322 RepID=UPI0025DB125C|nr:hypothetical protein [uncultured Chryseobacterium sp.]
MDIKYAYYNTSKGYRIVGGTASQFLKADGSVDNSSYVTTNTFQSIAATKVFISDVSNNWTYNSLRISGNNGYAAGISFNSYGGETGQLRFTLSGVFEFQNSEGNGYMPIKSKGFIKSGSDDNYVLTGGGSHKKITELEINSLTNYNYGQTQDLNNYLEAGKMKFTPAVLQGSPNLFPTANNANALLSISTWSDTNFGHDLGFSSDGNIYHRYKNSGVIVGDWGKIWSSNNLKKSEFVGSQIINGSYNANDLTTNSITYGYSVANAPSTVGAHSFTTLNLDSANPDYKMQLGFDLDFGEMYSRRKFAGNWDNDWTKFWHSENFNPNLKHSIDLGDAIDNGSLTRTNKSWFDYNWAGTGQRGSVINFSGLIGAYSTELFGSYDVPNNIGIRTRNGDTNTWNPAKWLWHSGNFNPNNKVNKTGDTINGSITINSGDSVGSGNTGTLPLSYKLFLANSGGDVARYGTVFWIESDGTGYIQQQRADGQQNAYRLSLQPYGGELYYGNSEVATKNWAIPKTHPAYGVTANNVYNWSGYLRHDYNMQIQPNQIGTNEMQFGFGSWNNNNNYPFADYLHFGGYADSSGGNQNLIMFSKMGFGLRQWQGTKGSPANYTSFVDYWNSNHFNQANVDSWNNMVYDYVTLNTLQSINGIKAFSGGTGNSYDTAGIRINGNGPADTIFPALSFHQPGLYAATIQYRGNGFYFRNIDNTSFEPVYSNAFRKEGSDNSYILLGGGGHKSLSEFVAPYQLDNYIPLSGTNNFTGILRSPNNRIQFGNDNGGLGSYMLLSEYGNAYYPGSSFYMGANIEEGFTVNSANSNNQSSNIYAYWAGVFMSAYDSTGSADFNVAPSGCYGQYKVPTFEGSFVQLKYLRDNYVSLNGSQTISGSKKFDSAVVAADGIISPGSDESKVFIGNGSMADMNFEIINENSEIRLRPGEYDVPAGGLLEISDPKRLIRIFGEQVNQTVNLKDVFPRQEYTIYNSDPGGNNMTVQINGVSIGGVNAGMYITVYIRDNLSHVIHARAQFFT